MVGKRLTREDRLKRGLENERALNALLRSFATDANIRNTLENCLNILLAISWLSLLPKGGVFLVDALDDRILNLVAEKDLGPKIRTLCTKVAFGHCLCGRAAEEKKILYSACIDHRHETTFDGIEPHGHYNIPIRFGERLLGVLVLYLEHGHASSWDELAFLQNVSDILAIIIERKQFQETLIETQGKLELLASMDELTGLYNRRWIIRRVSEEHSRVSRFREPMSVIMIDVDFFKAINDRYGHGVGDDVLSVVGRTISESIRQYDVAGRYGGEEFLVCLPKTTLVDARNVAERIRVRVGRACISAGDSQFGVTISLGIAESADNEDMQALLRRSDEALYRAKASGRNCIVE